MKYHPKILVISHNAFSNTFNNGKTFSKIFKNWPSESLAQLYFQNEQPDFEVCKNFFKITDENMLLEKRKNVGSIVLDNTKIVKRSTRIHEYVRKKPTPLFVILRNLLWISNKWKNDKLDMWIQNFNPEAIFLVGGSANFPYKIAYYISRRYNIPIYLYYTDDYISPIRTADLFWWVNFLWLKKSLKTTLKNVAKVFVIGEDMAHEYSAKLGKECITLMNAVDLNDYDKAYSEDSINLKKIDYFNIAYFGGLHLKRWITLLKIADSLKNIEGEYKENFKLHIYTQSSLDENEMQKFLSHPNIVLHSPVGADEIIVEMQKYHSLVHVESFDKKMINSTRLSISTKIPEYLASGCLVIGVGPNEVSSIKYLKKSGAAYVINSNETLIIDSQLRSIIKNKDSYLPMINKGLKIVSENHSISENYKKIFENISFEHTTIRERI